MYGTLLTTKELVVDITAQVPCMGGLYVNVFKPIGHNIGAIIPLDESPELPAYVPLPGLAVIVYIGEFIHKTGIGPIVGVAGLIDVTASVLVSGQFATEDVTTTV